MFTLKHVLKTVFFIVMAAGLVLFALMQRNSHKTTTNVFSQTITSPTFVIPTPTLLVPVSTPSQTTTMDSPDGTKTLTMIKRQINGLAAYFFYTSNKSDAVDKLIFKKTEGLTESFSIPYNTWSPDNVYFFLKEATPSVNNYYVFYVSGNLLPNNAQYVNIQELFAQKLPDFTLVDVTGWAAPNLVLVNTKTKQEGRDVSFWFDVPGLSFIQLSTYFN